MSFKDKVVLITGASAGNGAAIAVKFAEQKAAIVLVGKNEARLKEIAEKCQEHGPKPFMIIAEVSKQNDIKKVISGTITRYGKIDILINNTGIVGNAAIYDANAMEVYDRIMKTNLRSAAYLNNLATPHLIKTKGNVINVNNVAAVNDVASQHFSYCASETGIDHFTRTLALDLGPKGVRVSTVNPEHTAITDNIGLKKADADNYWDKWEEYKSLGKLSDSEEIGDLVLFLASDEVKAMTGSSYVTKSGLLIRRNIKVIKE